VKTEEEEALPRISHRKGSCLMCHEENLKLRFNRQQRVRLCSGFTGSLSISEDFDTRRSMNRE